MPREWPRSLVLSLAAHAGVVALLALTVHFVRPRPLRPVDTMTAHFLVEDTPAPTQATPLPPVPEPPVPPPPVPPPPTTLAAEITPKFEPEPVPAPLHPITTTSRTAPPAPVASHPRKGASAAPAPTAGANAAVGGGSSLARPRYAVNPAPAYPPEANRLKQQGVVFLRVKVGADGAAHDVTLKQSSGFAALDEAAIGAVRRWKFEPARLAGVAIASQVDVPVRFQIK